MKLIEDVGYDHSFSFIYSQRPGTPAASLQDEVPESLKKERLQRLQLRINEMATEISRGMLGSVQRVLIERISHKDASEVSGKTENNRSVTFAGDEELIGRFVDVKITDAFRNSLKGEVVAIENDERQMVPFNQG